MYWLSADRAEDSRRGVDDPDQVSISTATASRLLQAQSRGGGVRPHTLSVIRVMRDEVRGQATVVEFTTHSGKNPLKQGRFRRQRRDRLGRTSAPPGWRLFAWLMIKVGEHCAAVWAVLPSLSDHRGGRAKPGPNFSLPRVNLPLQWVFHSCVQGVNCWLFAAPCPPLGALVEPLI
jgi:hypothetical protein